MLFVAVSIDELAHALSIAISKSVVMWLSKHGDACASGNDQYPNVSIPVKQAYWANLEQLFQPMMVNVQANPMNVTPLGALIKSGQRLLVIGTNGSALILSCSCTCH
jgi:hypothetical protein